MNPILSGKEGQWEHVEADVLTSLGLITYTQPKVRWKSDEGGSILNREK